ncbi:hypothetical protein BH09VER1_BH09VER1_30990 [soil metagenome]
MKVLIPLNRATLVGVAGLCLAISAARATPPAGYTQVWADEFSGTALDTTHWTYGNPGPYRNGYNTPAAVTEAGGNLTITTYTDAGVHYTGFIGTRFKYQPLYGYMEARIRVVNTPGNWSAFWMFVTTVGATLDPHNDGTEPDIMEHRVVDNVGMDLSNGIDSALHWDGYAATHKSVTSGVRGAGLATGYHTYAMEWTPDFQKFYIDGTYLYTITNSTNTDPVPPLAPISHISEFFYLSTEILTGSWAGNIPAGGYGSLATSTTKMDVDYVRVYQNAPATPAAPVNLTVAPSGANWNLNWNLTDNAPLYNVKRATVTGGPYTTIATTGIVATNAAYTDTTALAGTNYYYVVSAVNGPQEGPNSLEVCTNAAGSPPSAHSGGWTAFGVFSGSASYAKISQAVTVPANTALQAGVWVRGSGRARMLVYAGSTALSSSWVDGTPTWTYVPIVVNTGTNTSLTLTFNDSSAIVGAVSLDDAFLGVAGGTNLVTNSGFESGVTGWNVGSAGAVWSITYGGDNLTGREHSGYQSVRGVFTGTTTYRRVSQLADVAPNTTYEAGLWAKGGGRGTIRIYAGSTQINSTLLYTATTSWSYFSTTVNTGTNTRLKISFDDEAPSATTMYLDDVFFGVSGSTNRLVNPDFERGSVGWDMSLSGTIFSIGQW